jgi:subtilisin-like proprotein convertase family protein
MITTDIRGCNTGMSYKDIRKGFAFNFGQHFMNRLCDYTNKMNGTSSATPVVAGVVALMLEANRNLTWRDVKHILAETSDEINFDPILASIDHPLGYDLHNYDYDFLWVENKAGYEFSNWYGFGRVNAKKAVEMAATWMSSNLGTFEQTKNSQGIWYYDSGALTSKTILDENAFALEDKIWVGHNFIIENIQISVTTDHPFPGDLGIVLESPQGTESRILNVNSKIYGDGLDDFIMATNAFYGEESEGFWKIKVVDGDSTFGTGDLLRWKILVNGHRKSTDLNKPYPPTSILFTGAPPSTDKSPIFAFVNSVSSSVSRYEAQVERASDGLVMKAWTNLGLVNSEHQFSGMALATGVVYQLKIRAINSLGQISSIQLKEWTAN